MKSKNVKVQKFFQGDLVMISNLPPRMSHFSSGLAIVIGSDADQVTRGRHGPCAAQRRLG